MGEPRIRGPRRIYSAEEKMVAVATYACYGSLAYTAKVLGYGITTLQNWSKTEWWDSAFRAERERSQVKLDAGYSRIIDKHIHKIETRLDDGDYAGRDKEGNILLKPVSAKDLAVIGGVLFDKRQLLRGLATSHTKNVDSDGLKKLQLKFEQLSGSRVVVIEESKSEEGDK